MTKEHVENTITWPVTCFSLGTMISFVNPEHWGTSNVLGVLSGWYNDMEMIDSAGKIYTVVEIAINPKITLLDRIFSFIVNRNVKVKLLSYKFKSVISLEDFKALVCKQIDIEEKETGEWSTRGEPDEIKQEIMKCSCYKTVMNVVLGPTNSFLPSDGNK